MNSTYVDVFGLISWPKIFEGNRDMVGYQKNKNVKGAYEDCNGAYCIDIELEADSVKRLEDAGCAKDLSKSKVKFIRKHSIFGKDGTEIEGLGGPPIVAKKDGTEWVSTEDGLIGNGSHAKVRLELVDYGESVGTRLDGVQILDHVPVLDDEGNTIKAAKARPRGFDAVEDSETPKKAAKPKVKVKALDDDEIPF